MDGIALVDKPAGPTSHDVVAVARRAFSTKKVGHTGTLDPFATGLLPLCIGKATRLVEFMVGHDKEYLATLQLGASTASHDTEGEILASDDVWRIVSRASMDEVLGGFVGTISQRPPKLSSIKIGGVPAHRRTRRGEDVQIPTRQVVIHELELVAFDPPAVEVRVRCSAGTYIRALARDVGEALGTGCHLTGLRRTAVGELSVDRAVGPEDLGPDMVAGSAWLTMEQAVGHLSRIEVDTAAALDVAQGRSVGYAGEDESPVAIILPGTGLVAVGEVRAGALKPRKVLWNG